MKSLLLLLLYVFITLSTTVDATDTPSSIESSSSSSSTSSSLYTDLYSTLLPTILLEHQQQQNDHNKPTTLLTTTTTGQWKSYYNECTEHDDTLVKKLNRCQQQQQQHQTLKTLKSITTINSNYGCTYCTMRSIEDRMQAFKYYFSSYLESQENATNVLYNVMTRKIVNPYTPTVILSAGDHGVGKTSSARIMSKVLFKVQKNDLDGDGQLLVDSESYKKVTKGDEASIRNARNQLKNRILEQLAGCPQSVIILDEIQKIHPLVLSVLEPFFEGLDVDGVPTNQAIYILTSDFEKEGVTRDKPLDELIHLIKTYSNIIYQDFKIMSLVTDIAPFKPLERSQFDRVIEKHMIWTFCNRLRPLGLTDMIISQQKHRKHKDVVAFNQMMFDKMTLLYSNENFRALEKSLQRIYDHIETHLLSNHERISTKHHYKNESEDLHLGPFTVPNHKYWNQYSKIILISVNIPTTTMEESSLITTTNNNNNNNVDEKTKAEKRIIYSSDLQYDYYELKEFYRGLFWNPFSNPTLFNISSSTTTTTTTTTKTTKTKETKSKNNNKIKDEL
ncbi:hypothetical protein DFA_00362 [Cavenderia fasciculata]|uniref:AAA+ ATPase domain-containing protein n=1 Tax=Cavenderia fasciculata TaxID=261658 RepID=F4PRE9_CACFS|nr:uncharacterized protein DFA_00362 [Cavenderia fasciculata]EGG20501.1 hypothetical protein DFA_00362 [Cavenderia fasciculata]|eukprot:XP_004358351.1 hypothetical protein DFA_00362 [Cavenderia fasciculata]